MLNCKVFLHCQGLKELNLNYNQLTELPCEIGKLTALEKRIRMRSMSNHSHFSNVYFTVMVSSNKLVRLPNEISGLVSLIELNMYNNKVSRFCYNTF